MAQPGILYISYDGMLEPLGQSQVLAYLERLARGRRIHLISFEKSQDWRLKERRESVGRRIADAGIAWHPLRYHKSPSAPATALDVATGSALAIALAVRHRLGIVHARSYVAGVMALAAKRATGASFLFDMRGFWADERVDGNIWRRDGRLYRAAKAAERKLLLAADHIVTLTCASDKELRRWPYLQATTPLITVIPTCADLDRFTIQRPPQRDPFVLGYVGSVGAWYLLDDMLRTFILLRQERPDARLLMVNRSDPKAIEERLAAFGIAAEFAEVASSTHSEMPRQIGRMSAGMAFYEPSYSRIACAPTKLAEYLGCGVPVIATGGVGDTEMLEREEVGIVPREIDDAALRQSVKRLLRLAEEPGLQQRCRRVAEKRFSLASGVAAYARIYESLAAAPKA